MLLKIKNKFLLSMEKMIKEAKDKGGVPDVILLEPMEAADFLKEIKTDSIEVKRHIKFNKEDNSDMDIRFLLKAELTNDRLLELVKEWYNKEFSLYYMNVEVKVVKKKEPITQVKVPSKVIYPELPPRLPDPIYRVFSFKTCEKCTSSLHTKWIFWSDGCLQPECENYYKK